MTHTLWEQKQATKTACEIDQMSNLTVFKVAIVNMFKKQKGTNY